MKDLEHNEKSSLLGIRIHHNQDDESNNGATFSCIRRWGVLSLIVMNVMVAIHYGFWTRNNSKNHLHHDRRNFFHILPDKDRVYTKTQTLGFQIHTGGSPAVINGTGEMNPECPNRYGLLGGTTNSEPEILCYVANDDPILDARERLRIMRDAVEKAYEVADPDRHTLKVFVAPEFFFRGLDGAYEFHIDEESGDACGPVCTVLQGLEDLVANPNYEDWFFLFGSVIAYEKIPQHESHHNDSSVPEHPFLFYNFAPLYKGYNPDTTNSYGKRFLLPKRYMSNLDFLTPNRYVTENLTYEILSEHYNVTTQNITLGHSEDILYNPMDYYQKKYNTALWNEYQDELTNLGYTFIHYDWVIIDDITMSIEICFDHWLGRALQTYMADIVTGSNTLIPKLSSFDDELTYVPIPYTQAQVSLVSSSGMTIQYRSLVLVNNGTIYLQDGLYDDNATIIWINRTEGKVDSALGGSEAIQRTAVVNDRDVHFDLNIVPVHNKVPVYDDSSIIKNDGSETAEWQMALSGVFCTVLYEPMIVVWEPKEVPNTNLHQQ